MARALRLPERSNSVHGVYYGLVGERGETPRTGQEGREVYAYAGNKRRSMRRFEVPASCSLQEQQAHKPVPTANAAGGTIPGRQGTAWHRAAMTAPYPQERPERRKTQNCGVGTGRRRVWMRHAPVLLPPPTYVPWEQRGKGSGQGGKATLPHGAADRFCSSAGVSGMLAEGYSSPWSAFLSYHR
jgi:hypothetical protein